MPDSPAPAVATTGPARATRRAWIAMAIAALVYFMAVVHRTSFGIAGIEASERFGIEATALSVLAMIQIAVYASMQLPAGALIDRLGSRTVLVVGSLIMAAGQVLLAFAPGLGWAVAARVLIGAGDAPIFIAGNQIAARFFPPRQVPIIVQGLGLIGQLGQVASAIPVAVLLHQQGWSTAFATLAALGVAAASAAFFGIRRPRVTDAAAADSPVSPEPRVTLREAIRPAGVRLGFWTHWLGLIGPNTVALLWGVPFLVQGQGLEPTTASALLTVMVVANIVAGPVLGVLTGRHPLRRSWLVLAIAVVAALTWASVLLPTTPRPMWQLVLWMAVTGACGPASLIGLDFARTHGVRGRAASAVGFANIGGFAATVVSVLLVGATLQLVSPAGASEYTLGEYRIALTTLVLPWALGIVAVVHARRRTRREMAAAGVIVPPLRDVLARRRAVRRG
ncbi:nitrate/nitrite transporter [Demequina sp. NBRC 110057]|uniref:MFS transporter n=1 Tax=Demequina sp. NBRC 110057 TaxID=1570346 RepID=UPI000A052709|nr:MFS transporter [Demequina sp. NBRC 110057]